MRIAVWRTGHEIADTVAECVAHGLIGRDCQVGYCTTDRMDLVAAYDTHIAYGILRGTEDVFKECNRLAKPWIHLDRGYFKPGHYDGYYRVSLNGTQQVTGLRQLAPDYDRCRALGMDLKPWRGFDHSKPVLVCYPSDHVEGFYQLRPYSWYRNHNYHWHDDGYKRFELRQKGDPNPINFSDYNYVLTFNSSVGWQALAAGIPCISDPERSIVGAWFRETKLTEDLSKAQETDRERLFGCMANLQLTLDEIRAGKLWPLISRLISSSALTTGSA